MWTACSIQTITCDVYGTGRGAARRLARRAQPFYLVVEKILTREEELPEWPVEGTTGYDFLVQIQRAVR